VSVHISPHAAQRAKERGASVAEIEETLATGSPQPAMMGRKCMRKAFRIDELRAGRRYSQKMVEVYYVDEEGAVVVVTVYVFYGVWGLSRED
jgi:hypothetical protein